MVVFHNLTEPFKKKVTCTFMVKHFPPIVTNQMLDSLKFISRPWFLYMNISGHSFSEIHVRYEERRLLFFKYYKMSSLYQIKFFSSDMTFSVSMQ